MVKNFLRSGSFDETESNPFINTEPVNELVLVNKKPVVPTEQEMKRNGISRSSKLRVAEKFMIVYDSRILTEYKFFTYRRCIYFLENLYPLKSTLHSQETKGRTKNQD